MPNEGQSSPSSETALVDHLCKKCKYEVTTFLRQLTTAGFPVDLLTSTNSSMRELAMEFVTMSLSVKVTQSVTAATFRALADANPESNLLHQWAGFFADGATVSTEPPTLDVGKGHGQGEGTRNTPADRKRGTKKRRTVRKAQVRPALQHGLVPPVMPFHGRLSEAGMHPFVLCTKRELGKEKACPAYNLAAHAYLAYVVLALRPWESLGCTWQNLKKTTDALLSHLAVAPNAAATADWAARFHSLSEGVKGSIDQLDKAIDSLVRRLQDCLGGQPRRKRGLLGEWVDLLQHIRRGCTKSTELLNSLDGAMLASASRADIRQRCTEIERTMPVQDVESLIKLRLTLFSPSSDETPWAPLGEVLPPEFGVLNDKKKHACYADGLRRAVRELATQSRLWDQDFLDRACGEVLQNEVATTTGTGDGA